MFFKIVRIRTLMCVFSMSDFDRKYLSLEISCYRDSVDMNVNHGTVKVCILFGVEGHRAGGHTLL